MLPAVAAATLLRPVSDPLMLSAPPRLLKPRRIRPGAVVGLVSPGYPLSAAQAQKALDYLTAQGYRIKPMPNWQATSGHLAGTDAQRLSDLHQAFSDPEVEVVWCARGGYGSTRLLPYVDYKLIRRNPKPFIGYSDITALHLAIGAQTGLVTFHGPGAASDIPEFAQGHIDAVLRNAAPSHTLTAFADAEENEAYRPQVLRGGKAQGRLIGGNLTLLSALAGTPYLPSFKGKIVFIEDIDERPYRIDRMLTQLLQSAELGQAAGIALGVFIDCAPKGDSPSFSLRETLQLCLGSLNMPILYGLPIGHMPRQAMLPCGIMAELDADGKKLTLLESGVL